MMKNDMSFEPLHTYDGDDEKFNLVIENLFEADDADGVIGNIIDKGLSFVPRAMRFKKAKTVMKRSLNKYISKAKSVIAAFAESSRTKIDNVNKEYLALKKGKIQKLIDDDNTEEASKILENFLTELQEYKANQIQLLDQSIKDIHTAYTASIDTRIDSPGFVLNVDLSDKGKGELKAKWQELSAMANMKIDEAKTNMLLKNESFKRLDGILSEVESFIENNKALKGDISFGIDHIKQSGDQFQIRSRAVIVGARYNVKEKGLILGDDPNNMGLDTGGKKYVYSGRLANTASPYDMVIRADIENYVMPYMIIHESKKPVYGDLVQISDMVSAEDTSSAPTVNTKVTDSDGLGDTEIINKGDHNQNEN